MGRDCAQCGYFRGRDEYSSNQWRKGFGSSRCHDCVNGNGYGFSCQQCGRTFADQNQLNMHMQVHRPRDVACPICGVRKFRSGANAVQHVESGYCHGCRGQDNAREQIYQFASRQSAMRPYMSDVPMLTNGNGSTYIPDFPYHCPNCSKSFRHLSQLLQHQDQKHNSVRMISY